MRILVISKDSWDTSNSFGNTFHNLFNGMEDVEIYNLCFKSGPLNDPIVEEAMQITDGNVLKSVLKRKKEVCFKMTYQPAIKAESNEEKMLSLPRNTFTFLCRDAFWKLGAWKKSKAMKEFLDRVKPDVVYMPLYNFWYLCDIQEYLIKQLNVPVAGYIVDDIYGDLRVIHSPFRRIYTRVFRHKLKKLVAKCSYLEVFAENMQREYGARYNKKCYLIGKGVDFTERPLEEISATNVRLGLPLTFLYTGNLGMERYKVLCNIAKELEKRVGPDKAILKVFCGYPLEKDMKKAFAECKNLVFGGKITFAEVQQEQSKTDYLVFVEGFSKSSIAAVRMSFSTKIVDYMMARKPIFAIGPNEVYPIELLKNNDLAVVSTSPEELEDNVSKALEGKIDTVHYVNKSIAYLKEKRDIKVIQEGMRSRMATLINEGKQE